MSGKINIDDIFLSVESALGLVADRDNNPELDRSCYCDPTEKKLVNVIHQNIQEIDPEPKPIITDNDLTEDQKHSPDKKETIEISIQRTSKTYINRSIKPPNKGNPVKSIDDLVDKIKWRHNLHMFSSVPSIKAKIDPSKFSGLVRNNVSVKPIRNLDLNNNENDGLLGSGKETPSSEILGSDREEDSNYPKRVIYPNNVSDPSDSFEIVIVDDNNNEDDIIYIDFDNIFPCRNEPEKYIEEIFDYDNIIEERTNVNQSWSVLDVATKATPPGWIDVFESCLPEIEHINKSLIKDEKEHGAFYPQKADIFKAFDMCPLQNVKVVIIGQDPYHSNDHNGYPIAMGMSFSVRRGNTIPSSLNNIYKELSKSLYREDRSTGEQSSTESEEWSVPGHGDLSSWARQGVLLLNMCLTVRAHQAKSHKSLWMGFIAKIIASINVKNPNCIYVMWGREAERIQSLLTDKNIKLVAPHPSGFSANKGFIGCGHFVKINEHLEAQGRKKINWSL